MEENLIFYGLRIASGVAAVTMFALLWLVYGEAEQNRKVLTTYRELCGLVRSRQRESTRYRQLEDWMVRNGAMFHYGKRVTPSKYILVRVILGLVGACVTIPVWNEVSILVGIGLFFLPNGLLLYLNGRDNERLLPELKLVYNAMELQIKAGVYVTDALAECYGSVKEERLRTALLDLAGDIVVRADIYEALEHFRSKFDNRYIDSLCITILQALESGQAVELLRDISEQIKDMEQALLERKKAALDRRLTFYQLLILCAVLGVALYACITKLLGAAMRI